MDELPLADELALLERRLAGHPRMEPPPGLRERVMAALGEERSRLWAGFRGRLGWRWLAAGAAAVLLWLNFSMSVVNNMDWRLDGGPSGGDIERAAGLMSRALPELPEREAFRQALLLGAGSQVVPAPRLHASLHRILEERKREAWDMR
jgi:hypothetical protein